MRPKLTALAVAGASSEKKALDILIIDMRKVSSVCDYFVIASGTSTTQVRAISDNIVRRLEEKGTRLWHIEGEPEALWIVQDYGDVVAHVFEDNTRKFYELERLWQDAPQTLFKETKPKKVRAHAKPKRKLRVKAKHKRARKR